MCIRDRVIGINGYRQWPKLETAVDDAKTVAGVLSQKFGYKTNLLIDATAVSYTHLTLPTSDLV